MRIIPSSKSKPVAVRLAALAVVALACLGMLGDRARPNGATARHAHADSSPEAFLPEMLELTEEASPDPAKRRLRIHIVPKIGGRARLVIESEAPTRLVSASAAGATMTLEAGGLPLDYRLEIDRAASAGVAVRVGLVFVDERGEVTMSMHREVPRGPSAPASPAARSARATDATGANVVSYFPPAPEPSRSRRRP